MSQSAFRLIQVPPMKELEIGGRKGQIGFFFKRSTKKTFEIDLLQGREV